MSKIYSFQSFPSKLFVSAPPHKQNTRGCVYFEFFTSFSISAGEREAIAAERALLNQKFDEMRRQQEEFMAEQKRQSEFILKQQQQQREMLMVAQRYVLAGMLK